MSQNGEEVVCPVYIFVFISLHIPDTIAVLYDHLRYFSPTSVLNVVFSHLENLF